jgi:transmembrane sensor
VVEVEQLGEQGRVQVLAGSADVRGSAGQTSPVALVAGEGVTVNSGAVQSKESVPPAPDWTRGMLQFDGTRLGDAVALANRYSERHIVLGSDLDTLRVTGAFRAGDTSGLARALAAAFDLSLQQRPDGNLMLSRRASPAIQKKKGG